MFAVSTGMTGRAALLAKADRGRTGVEEAALWGVLGVTALVGMVIAGASAYERLHRRRAEALGRRKKQRIQL